MPRGVKAPKRSPRPARSRRKPRYHSLSTGVLSTLGRWLWALVKLTVAPRPEQSQNRGPRRPDRRPPAPRWLSRGGRTLAIVVVAGLLVGMPTALVRSGWLDRQVTALGDGLLALSADAGLAVSQIMVEGRAEAAREEIMAALRAERGTPILGVSPRAAKRRLESLDWVATATVERRLPGIVYVTITERQPLAIWQHSGTMRLMDGTGAVFGETAVARYGHLPVLVGADVPEHGAALLRLLAEEPSLAERVTAAVRVGGRRWNLKMANGTEVRLPAQSPELAWSHLASLHRRHQVLDRKVETVDLRIPDRMILRAADGSPQALPAASQAGSQTGSQAGGTTEAAPGAVSGTPEPQEASR